MLKNFFKLALRNLLKRKAFSFITIFGLALGVGACFVILKYMDFETSYDNFHESGSSLYRLTRYVIQNGERKPDNVVTTYGLGPALVSDIPEVKRYIRTHTMYGGVVISYNPSGGNPIAFHENKTLIVDSTFLRAFSFAAVNGNAEKSLDDPNSIVITATIAKKYFGDNDPIGKTLKLEGGWCDGLYNVAAVLKDIPQNSHFSFQVLIPMHNLLHNNGQYQKDDGWDWNNFITYVQLNNKANLATTETKVAAFAKAKLDPRNHENGFTTGFNLQPLNDIHLTTGIRHDEGNISRSTVYFFGVIAVFILFIAWINYINLSTARAMERAREVGIKKTIGAIRRELIVQFMAESVLVNFAGMALAVLIALLLLPILSDILGKTLTLNLADSRFWLVASGLFFVGSLASGLYPAFVLSSHNVITSLKGNREGSGFSLRKALVVFQFAASMILIAGTFVVYRQVSFMNNQYKGLTMDQMLIVTGPRTLPWKIARQRMVIFKEELRKIPGVDAVATSAAIPGGGHNWGADIRRVDDDPKDSKSGSVVWVDPDFIPTYNIPLIAGKNFDLNSSSSMKSTIVNEAVVASLHLGTPAEAINQRVVMGDDTVEISGVLKNYNWNSLKTEYVPFYFRTDTITTSSVSIHISDHNLHQTVEAVNKLYKDLIPGDPFQYYFLDDFFNGQYQAEQQFGKVFGLFAILAVIISCLGLWGLASFTTSQKMKEIGVRKVLGASAQSIVILLSLQFLRLVVIASVVALPLVAYGMNSWLKGFAFHVGLRWDLFVLPVILLGSIALLTVSVQVIRGASVNPARVLKTE